jgi:hypothetical protein
MAIFRKNDIRYGQDFSFKKGIPEGINFDIEPFGERSRLTADGYGSRKEGESYGNGCLYVSMPPDKLKKFCIMLKIANKKIVIDKSKWNRVFDGILPEKEQEVFYWFEFTGLNEGRFDRYYCEELKCEVNTFYSPRGFLTDEDVYWLPKDALPFEFIYEEEKQ